MQVNAASSRATVNCHVSGSALARCQITLTVRAAALRRASRATTTEAGTVVIGRATVTPRSNATDVKVTVTLNATGRRALQRLGTLPILATAAATTTSGQTITTQRATTLRLRNTTLVRVGTMFASGSSTLLPATKRWLNQQLPLLTAAHTIECRGHTDNRGTLTATATLGLARAKTVCAYLAHHGITAKRTTTTRGETHPRATNNTPIGRAKNRRVELHITY
ncbi:MAG: OmpA family protein [Patulibacter sp.]